MDYELIDFGRGRKLERFGDRITDRPSVAASDLHPTLPASRWRETTDLCFEDRRWLAGSDAGRLALESGWTMRCGKSPAWAAELRPTAAGQVGCFPEHFDGFERAAAFSVDDAAVEPKLALNLFAHTGIGSMQLAARGWSVTHVDSSRPAVRWAKQNAAAAFHSAAPAISSAAPIRFIVDDAAAFVARELRRGRRYDLICLDPPSYGHGGRGAWRIDRDLGPLLALVADLLHPGRGYVMLCGHSEPSVLRSALADPAAARLHQRLGLHRLIDVNLTDRGGRTLHSGYRVIWSFDAAGRSGTA